MPHATTLLSMINDALTDLKAQDIKVLDVSELTAVTDFMVIATGTSSRHVRSIANQVLVKAKEHGYEPLGHEGEAGGEWILIDLADAVVHIMLAEARQYYDLERLWASPKKANVD